MPKRDRASSSTPPTPRLAEAGRHVTSDDQKWCALLKKKRWNSDKVTWIKLAAFLKEVKQHAGHAARFVDEDEGGKQLWVLRGGRKPKESQDWAKKPGSREGGILGGGIIHCRKTFAGGSYTLCHS